MLWKGKMKKTLLMALVFLGVSFNGFAKPKEIYEGIEIREVLSNLIIRDMDDCIYSGQIKSQKGFTEFINKYLKEKPFDLKINFEKKMLIFGITDDISSKAFRFFKNKHSSSYVLDYYDTGICRKMRNPGKNKKYSYLQIFVVDRIDGIPHIRVKNLVSNKLSKTYK